MNNFINTDLLVPVLAILLLFIALWWVTSYLNTKRVNDRERRDKRIPYLIDTYRRLVRASQAGIIHNSLKRTPDLESALIDIQLFGRRSQVKKAKEFIEAQQANSAVSLDPLLMDIRDELRRELRLSKIRGPIFRV